MSRTDAELVSAACRGDLTSFGHLYERHYRLAVGLAHSRLMDRHLAEDAAQEAFAVACRTLATLQDRDCFPQWLGTICRRVASRIAVRRPRHEPLTEDHEADDDPAAVALRLEVQEALGELDESSREIVLLHYFSGLSHDAIAQTLNLSVAAIHGRLQRTRRKLATKLESQTSSGTRK